MRTIEERAKDIPNKRFIGIKALILHLENEVNNPHPSVNVLQALDKHLQLDLAELKKEGCL